MILARCPACQTVFRVRPEHLRARHGEVRCGQCLSAFNALDHLVETPTAAPAEASPSPRAEAAPSSPTPARPRSDTFFVLEEKTPPAPDTPPSPPPAEPPAAGVESEPEIRVEAPEHPSPFDFEEPAPSSPPRESDERHRNGDQPPEEAVGGQKASTFDSLADRLEFEIPESFLTQVPPEPEADAERMNHVRYRQRKMEWPEIPRPAGRPFPEFVAPAGRGGRREAEDERAEAGKATAEPRRTERNVPRADEIGARPTARTATAPPDETPVRPAPESLRPEPAIPSPPPVSPSAVDAALRSAAAEAQADDTREPEPRLEPIAPDRDELDMERLDERYGPPRRSGRSRGLWGLGLGLLMGMLAVQAAYLFRDEITRTWPQMRPAFVLACEYLGCTLELPRIAAAIEIETSDLLSDPQRRGSFILNAVVRNNAPHPQAYPYLELTLTDARDRPVIRRALSPGEWVPAEKLERGFLAGEEISVRLPFEAADVEAVGYRIYAFYP